MRWWIMILTGLAALIPTVCLSEAMTGTVKFKDQAHPHPVSGFGGEWDPHFWRQANAKRGCDEAQWEKVCAKIQEMSIGRVRMMILPDWYEQENDDDDPDRLNSDGFTWDSEPMLSLRRHLDFCQKARIRVTLTWWCAPLKRQSDGHPYWLSYQKVNDWCSAPNSVPEAAENVVAGLWHLVKDRGYSCIDSFTYVNEPDWTYHNDEGAIDFEHYIACCRAIQEGLRAAGLRDQIQLNLADASMHKGWLDRCVGSLGDVADTYNAHSYVFSVEDPDYPKAIREWVRNWVRICAGSPFATNELGTRHTTGAYSVTDLETFERAFLVSQYAILGLCEGMTGALFWGLHDQYYYEGDPNDGSNGGLMKTNLMAYVDEDWRVRPTGQVGSLIRRGAPIGARVHPGDSTDPDVDAVALDAGESGTHVLAVNRAKDPRTVTLHRIPGSQPGVPPQVKAFTREGLRDLAAETRPETLSMPAESVVLATFPGRPGPR